MGSFSQRHGYELPNAEITIRHEAPDWLRENVVDLAYELNFQPSDLRAWLCRELVATADRNNWSQFPNIDGEVRELLTSAPWFVLYDLIEWLPDQLAADRGLDAVKTFNTALNRLFRLKGVGWQLVDAKLQVRGPEVFEEVVKEAVRLTGETQRKVARQEFAEALADLSRRPQPEITGAIQHAMAALECVAKDVTGETKLTLGEWVKKNTSAFPQPLGAAVEKLWGYSSQYGRHVVEGKPAGYEEAELVVGVAGALSIYLMRKSGG